MSSMQRRLLAGIAIGLVLAGVAAGAVGCIPYDRMQSAGALVRRAADFTPERFARFRHVCRFFAISLPVIAAWLWRLRGRVATDHPPATPASPVADAARSDRLVWLIVALAFALRLQRIADPVAYDEAYTYLNFASRPWYEAIGDYNSTNNHLLNTLLMHASTRLFGPQEWALRWHVLLAGGLLPWAAYVWTRDWLSRPVGFVTAAAIAVSPALITYSVDARGYMLVALAAVVLDAALGRLAHGASARVTWCAGGALVAGLCAMPLMLYAGVASTAWFVLTPFVTGAGPGERSRRIRAAAQLWALAVPAVAAFYAPAYIFRGLMFLNDPIMRAAQEPNFAASLWTAWTAAFTWWTDGIVPGFVWGGLALVGLCIMPGNALRLRWGLPFAVALALNVVQHVAPPPRIYLHLAPWLYAAAAVGLVGLLHVSRRTEIRNGSLAVMVLLGIGGGRAYLAPVLFHASERANFVSVPDAIAAVQQAVPRHPADRQILLAPLPCDLPSIFSLRRSGAEIPVNVRPEAGDRVYLLARPDETPEQVLATPLLNMPDLAPRFDNWLKIGEFETLDLYVSRLNERP